MLSTAGSTSFKNFPLQQTNNLSIEKVRILNSRQSLTSCPPIDNLFRRRKWVVKEPTERMHELNEFAQGIEQRNELSFGRKQHRLQCQ